MDYNNLLYLLIGFLLAVTLAYIVFLITNRNSIKNWDSKLFEEIELNRIGVSSVGENVKDLKTSVDGLIIPKLELLNKRLDVDSFYLAGGNIADLIKKIGFEHVFSLSESAPIAGFGIEEGDLRVSFVVLFDQFSNDLIIRSASSLINIPDPMVMRDLMNLNAEVKIGKIGILKDSESYLVSVDHSIHVPSDVISFQVLSDAINRIFSVHDQIREVLTRRSIVFRVVLLVDHVRFLFNVGDQKDDGVSKSEHSDSHEAPGGDVSKS